MTAVDFSLAIVEARVRDRSQAVRTIDVLALVDLARKQEAEIRSLRENLARVQEHLKYMSEQEDRASELGSWVEDD